MAARRAIWRWAWRTLRREWRGQVAIVVLVVASVALSVGGGLALYNLSAPDEAITSGAQFSLDGAPEEVEEFLRQLGAHGAVQRASVGVAGTSQLVQLRAVDLRNPVLDPLVDLRAGVLPVGPGETAMTTGLSAKLGAPVGSTIRLDDFDLAVVGIVENPTDLNDQFLLVDDGSPPRARFSTTYLTKTSIDAIDDGEFPGGVSVNETTPPRAVATVMANVGSALTLMLVGLLATASFGVVARRRMRQFGLLGAIGARPKQLRGAAAFNGFAIGLLAAVIGAVVGVVVVVLVVPRLEGAIGHRIDFEVPLLIVAPPIAVATVVCTLAAWLPARAMARQSIVETLAARRPTSQPTRSFAGLGVVLAGVGYFMLGRTAADESAIAPLASMALLVVGVLLLTPAVIALLGRIVASGSLPLRIAGRDLARFQARSAAALGAIVLALAVPVGVGVTTASYDAGKSSGPPNLDAATAIVWGAHVDHGDGSIRAVANVDVGAVKDAAERAAAIDPALSITEIQVPIDATMGVFADDDGRPTVGSMGVLSPLDCAQNVDGDTASYGSDDGGATCFLAHQAWVATPELAQLWDFDHVALTEPHSMAVREPGDYLLRPADNLGLGAPSTLASTAHGGIPNYASFPEALVTLDALGEGFEAITVGWIVSSNNALTPSLVAELRNAMGDNAELETFSEPVGNEGLRTIVALGGLVVGLIILGATVTLVRDEMVDGDRVLTVLGATAHVRRAVAGYTAGLLALVGAVLAIPLGYVGLIVGRAGGVKLPHAIPWSTLLIVFVVFPLVAAGASGLLSSKQPAHLGRTIVR